jgi:hypothetical protein
MATPSGDAPMDERPMLSTSVIVAVSITLTVLDPLHTTYTREPSGVTTRL